MDGMDMDFGLFYTERGSKRHYKFENLAKEQLKKLESEIRAHHEFQKSQMASQMELVARLEVLATSYLNGTTPEPCCDSLYTYFSPYEDQALQDYSNKTRLLNASNTRLMTSLDKLRRSKLVFEAYCSQLDQNIKSSFVLGDNFQKPLQYFVELVNDCFEYFHASVLNLSYRPSLMEPFDIECLAEYKKFLQPSDKIDEYLAVGLTFCKCL